jgi:hypothetical protein
MVLRCLLVREGRGFQLDTLRYRTSHAGHRNQLPACGLWYPFAIVQIQEAPLDASLAAEIADNV